MQIQSLSQSLILKIRHYVIHFPSGYQFVLKVPQQITVRQISDIVRSYTALHNAHGLKDNGSTLKPMYLTSIDHNLLMDLYLSDSSVLDKTLSPLPSTQFNIQYSATQNKQVSEINKYPISKFYQFLSKIPNYILPFSPHQQLSQKPLLSNYIVRNRTNCKLYTLTKIPKNKLTYIQFQNIISMRDYYIKTSRNHNNQFTTIYQCFQTEQSLCIVSSLYPFQMSRLKIQSKFLLQSVLSQIARIVHILSRDGYQIGDIVLSDFWMDFKFQVYYCGIHEFVKQNKNIGSQSNRQIKQEKQYDNEEQVKNQYGRVLSNLLEELFKNSVVKLIQFYLPLFHWLKNQRIKNYLEFLKYFQIMPNANLNDDHYDTLRQEIISNLFKSYLFTPTQKLPQRDIAEFLNPYQPKTSIFLYDQMKKQQKVPVQNKCKPKLNIEEIFQQISTVKKKKQKIAISCKPFDIGKSLRKVKQNKKKPKGKSFILKNPNFLGSSKTKRHKRIISQFLIDD